MVELDWDEIKKRYSKDPVSHTKTGRPFRISRIDLGAVYIDLPSGEQSVSRKYLEKATRLIGQGTKIRGPGDYKELVYDERPVYAWAILRDAKLIK